MNGQEIYNKYQAFRDYTGSPQDEYAQLLSTIRSQYLGDGSTDGIDASFFRLLEHAESESAKLSIKDPFPETSNIYWDDITPEMIELIY
ncbi:hypothetical protein ACR79B_02540 [Sphingobacterium spiritivorum]|uniref:hypothetical protein n=1 Tax=Sphingobacterium spiritivorum TaxID=258 RepID=UPI003DA1D4CF